MKTDFQGRRILVTGGRSGIGRAVVQELREQGAAVATLDLVPPSVGRQQVAQRRSSGIGSLM